MQPGLMREKLALIFKHTNIQPLLFSANIEEMNFASQASLEQL
jgi:hypothetical protein